MLNVQFLEGLVVDEHIRNVLHALGLDVVPAQVQVFDMNLVNQAFA